MKMNYSNSSEMHADWDMDNLRPLMAAENLSKGCKILNGDA